MNADGTGTRRLTSTKRTTRIPRGRRTAQRSRSRGTATSTSMSADGSDARRISDVSAEESEPAWSPDGGVDRVRPSRRPARRCESSGSCVPTDRERHALTSRTDGRFTPAWSPDSTRIVFAIERGGDVYELFTIGVDGKGLRSVAPTPVRQLRAVLVAGRDEDRLPEDGAIFTVELGGGDVEKLTDNENNDSQPGLEPAAAARVRRVALRTCRSARRPRAAASRRARPRGSRSRSPLSPRPRRARPRRSRRGTTTTPSSSPTTQSPGSIRTVPIVTGTCVASSSQRQVESSGVTKRQKTGKPSSRMKPMSRQPPSRTQPATPRALSEVTESSPRCAEVVLVARVHGDVTCRHLAEHREHLPDRPSYVVISRRRASEDRVRLAGEPRTRARAAGSTAGASGRWRPRASRMSASAAV